MNTLGPLANSEKFQDRVRRNLKLGLLAAKTAYIAPGAAITGHVILGEYSSVWPQTSIRGDIEPVHVGEGSNIQDAAVLHVADNLPCRIGRYCTIGHSAIVHACTIGDECLIGMGAIVLDGSQVGPRSIIGAGALVTQNTIIPDGSLVYGSPARVIRSLSPEEQSSIRHWAERYVILAREYQTRNPTHLA
jgi:gamma-carbonic anhydrase